MTKKDHISLLENSEAYCDGLRELDEIESNGNNYIFKVGVNEELAKRWVEEIVNESEVIKWTADPKKRSTQSDILQKNKPGEPKNIATYSLWSTDGKLAAVSWYQVWEPGEEEMKYITRFCKEQGVDNPYITTSAFRVAAHFRGQGLAKKIISLTEKFYASYLSEKINSSVNLLFTLETDQNNKVAVHTYESSGYVKIGEFDQPDKEPYRGKRLLMVKRHK